MYMGHNATHPTSPAVTEAMAAWWGEPANPSSVHRAGRRAAVAVEEAQAEVAALIGARAVGVVFTSGATEANHHFLRGVLREDRDELVVSAVEHPCVHAAAHYARQVTTWPVDRLGRVAPTPLGPRVAAIAVMAANHETGVLQPLDAVRSVAGTVPILVDATQAAGRVPLQLDWAAGVALSAHKLGGPPGIGALVLPDGEDFPPLLSGGSQQRGRRAGTVPTALVVGFGVACRLARARLTTEASRQQALRDRLEGGLRTLGARIAGEGAARLPNTTLAVFDGLPAETVVQALDLRGICVSAGAACSSGSVEESPVLRAMADPSPGSGVRFSLGTTSTVEHIDTVLATLPGLLERLRTALE